MRLEDGFGALVAAVQTNCHIADARHAADLPLCIYLLQMRELYRWEQGLPYTAALDRQDLGQWLARREALWSQLESRTWVSLPIGSREFDPGDVEGLNAALAPHGLVYGAGLAGADRPSCFLAALQAQSCAEEGLALHLCGREHARGLFAPPAVLAGGRTIVLRRDSLARWLWEKFEAFSLHRADGPMKALLDGYGLHDGDAFSAALPRLVDDLSEVLVLHETGEYRAGLWMEPAWGAMRLGLTDRLTDLRVRSVRDQWADCVVTLPTLVRRGHDAALHFWFANYDGLRQRLCPALLQAYGAWRRGDGGRSLLNSCAEAARHFRTLARQVLALHARLGPHAAPQIEQLLAAPQSVCAAGSAVP